MGIAARLTRPELYPKRLKQSASLVLTAGAAGKVTFLGPDVWICIIPEQKSFRGTTFSVPVTGALRDVVK